ncbi:APC family permease [Kibdelosporangium aridum]|uniref:L-asparagine transporter n=1 Tax=Kibdelosporangium aridum TaxID=2030 RepID=A0A1Y5Y8A6_KIBAR|nr:APC family permease [Kibdelosporangium aridum]SMD27007.1 L-asparagine transporter [Kibdelosporangium aridum]
MSEIPTLKRTLTLRDLIVYGLLFIGPLAPVGVFGVLDGRSGGAVALVYLIATIAMGLTAYSYATMSTEIPKAGSVFSYATAGLGKTAGFFAGWLVLLDYLLIPSVAYLFTGIATNALVPEIPIWLATGVAILLTTTVNLLGVRLAAVVGFIVLVVEIVLLAVFVVAALAVLISEGAQRPWLSPFTGVSGFDLTAVVGAVSVAVLSYLGFDAIASFAEENVGPSRIVGRATLFCLVLAGGLFVLQTYLGALLTPVDPSGPDGQVFYEMLRSSIGPWLAVMITTVKAIGPAFSAMVAQAAVGRLIYSMARESRLPRQLASIDSRTKTPWTAILVSAVLTLVIAVWAAGRDDGLDILVSIVDVGALAAFTLLHLSVIGYFRGRYKVFAHLVVPTVGAAVMIAVLALSSTTALIVGAIWLAIGIVVNVAGSRARVS